MHVTLPEILDLTTAPALRDELLEALGSGGPVSLGCAAVERVDTAGAQVLVAFVRALERRGGALTWTDLGAPARASLARLGVAQQLTLA